MKTTLLLCLALVVKISEGQDSQVCDVSHADCIARHGEDARCTTNTSMILCSSDTSLCSGNAVGGTGDCLCCGPGMANFCPARQSCTDMKDGAFCHKGQPTADEGLECNPNFGICSPNSGHDDCLCCWKKETSYCQDLKCNEEYGGQCFEFDDVPRDDPDYECVNPPGQESLRLCGNVDCGCCWRKNVDVPCPEPSFCMQVTGQPLASCYNSTQLNNNTNLQCYDGAVEACGKTCRCCWPKEEPNHCQDVGCAQQHQGLGQCVNISTITTTDQWDELRSQYDMKYSNPWGNRFCKPSDGNMDKDCCVCLKKQPCKDEGCFQAGGICADMQKVNLQWDEVMQQIDFPTKIPGNNLCTPQDVQQQPQSRQDGNSQSSCCECYKRKVNTTSSDVTPKCEDTGCGKLWDGHGQCVNMSSTSWSQIHGSYDLTSDTDEIKNDRSLCKSSSSDMECCRCFRKKPCADNGCEKVGGRCVDILRANLVDENVFPLNTVDLDAKINGTDLCKGSETEKCCECYKLKELA